MQYNHFHSLSVKIRNQIKEDNSALILNNTLTLIVLGIVHLLCICRLGPKFHLEFTQQLVSILLFNYKS